MNRILLILCLTWIPLFSSGCAGCTWQANSGSQAVTFTPGEGFAPADGPGYMNGEPMDMRGSRD